METRRNTTRSWVGRRLRNPSEPVASKRVHFAKFCQLSVSAGQSGNSALREQVLQVSDLQTQIPFGDNVSN